MELTVSNPNLHPIWAKVLGITPQTTSPHQGWQATSHPRRPGAPVGIKKQVGPGLWVSTVARPGDALYPA